MSSSRSSEGHRHDWAGRRVAVTGGTGFVGHHLVALLRAAGAAVTATIRPTSASERLRALGCDCVLAPLDDVAALTRAFAGAEVVFHVAAAVDLDGDLRRLEAINVTGTRNVLAAARAAGVRRVVHTSSISAVGASRRPERLDERAAWGLGPLGIPYITTKRRAEEAALAANGAGLEVVVGNPGCVLGPDDFTRSEFGTLCRRFWRGQVRVYFPGGNNFVDVRDVADGLLRLARQGRPGHRYLLTGEDRTFAEFFAALAAAAGRRYFRVPLPAWVAPLLAGVLGLHRPKPGARPVLSRASARLMGLYFFFDSSRARTELGWRARPLAEALRDAHAFWMPGRS